MSDKHDNARMRLYVTDFFDSIEEMIDRREELRQTDPESAKYENTLAEYNAIRSCAEEEFAEFLGVPRKGDNG